MGIVFVDCQVKEDRLKGSRLGQLSTIDSLLPHLETMSILETLVRRKISGNVNSHALSAGRDGNDLMLKSEKVTLTNSFSVTWKDHLVGKIVDHMQGESNNRIPLFSLPCTLAPITPSGSVSNPPPLINPAVLHPAPGGAAGDFTVGKSFKTVMFKVNGIAALSFPAAVEEFFPVFHLNHNSSFHHGHRIALQGIQHSLLFFSRYLYLLQALGGNAESFLKKLLFPQVLPHVRFLSCTSRFLQSHAVRSVKIVKKMGRQRRNPLWADDDDDEDDDANVGSINAVSLGHGRLQAHGGVDRAVAVARRSFGCVAAMVDSSSSQPSPIDEFSFPALSGAAASFSASSLSSAVSSSSGVAVSFSGAPAMYGAAVTSGAAVTTNADSSCSLLPALLAPKSSGFHPRFPPSLPLMEEVHDEEESLPASDKRDISTDSPFSVCPVGEGKNVQQQQQQQQQQRQHQQRQQCLPQLRFLFCTHQFHLSDRLKRQPKSTDPISGVGSLERSENSPSIVVIHVDSSVDGRAGQLRDAEPDALLSGIPLSRILLFRQKLHRRRRVTRRWKRERGGDGNAIISPTAVCNVRSGRAFVGGLHDVDDNAHSSRLCSQIIRIVPPSVSLIWEIHHRVLKRWERNAGDDDDDVNALCSCACARIVCACVPVRHFVRRRHHWRPRRVTSSAIPLLLGDDATEKTTPFCSGAAVRFARRQRRRYSRRQRRRYSRRCRHWYCFRCHLHRRHFRRRRHRRRSRRHSVGHSLCRQRHCRRCHCSRRRRCCFEFTVLLVWVEVIRWSLNRVLDDRASPNQAFRNLSQIAARSPGDTFDVF